MKRFLAACQEGHTEIAFSATGTNLQLVFNPLNQGYMSDQCDFEKEQGKVSHYIVLSTCNPSLNPLCCLPDTVKCCFFEIVKLQFMCLEEYY